MNTQTSPFIENDTVNVHTVDYIVHISPTALAEFVTYVDMLNSLRSANATIVGLTTAYTEAEWDLPHSKALVKVRAVGRSHYLISGKYTATWRN